jgi:hypothetical protein
MHAPGPRSPSVPIGAETSPLGGLAVDVLATYIEWRENAPLVAAAYERWRSAARPERPGRFAAYTAGLDKEEVTARTYARAILELERWSAQRLT